MQIRGEKKVFFTLLRVSHMQRMASCHHITDPRLANTRAQMGEVSVPHCSSDTPMTLNRAHVQHPNK